MTNYIFQSLAMMVIFDRFGLGFKGKAGPALGLAVTLAIFSVQRF